jgi:hypothetical protein
LSIIAGTFRVLWGEPVGMFGGCQDAVYRVEDIAVWVRTVTGSKGPEIAWRYSAYRFPSSRSSSSSTPISCPLEGTALGSDRFAL